ncbi:ABC transporter ATP-binding protein [Microbacterium nymphoidis]|uniref:ABC transporter ATP-binding protein n=1 Tax=Microbacterium nymphoidis TaxID=2898586 RepID=UPI001E558932|nr:ABC transporter ATP-binding protein [Microbacterium nymphoidis]MCD2497720.1 ABC transporter ATP-binding protein [Microbacterium nymphoidis]
MNTTQLASDVGTGGILCEGVVRIFTAQGIEVQALQGLNLTVDTGEMVALVGASGSGKSTLLGILAGLDAPTAGVAQVAGHDLTTMRRAERLAYRRRSVGFVWQQSSRNLLPYLTARENIAMAHTVARVVPKPRRGALSDELFELLEIGDIADRRPAQLSGGQQQRVAIAVALANEPRVLLADEPTGELDEATGAEVLAAMETVNAERGVTTLIVTHDAAITQHVGRTVRIRDGRTSTETLRSTLTGADGETTRVAEEYAVMDRAGRLQLPQEFVSALHLRDRVKVSLEPDHVQVRPSVPPTRAAAPPPGDAPGTSAAAARPLTRAEARAARAAAAAADTEGGR